MATPTQTLIINDPGFYKEYSTLDCNDSLITLISDDSHLIFNLKYILWVASSLTRKTKQKSKCWVLQTLTYNRLLSIIY